MEKIIFLGLAIPIMFFVLYLGASAIKKGFSAKEVNRAEKDNSNNNLSEELSKLNDLLKNEVITQEEFEKAKKKLLDI
jgi:predicted Zn-dependent peptidase